MFNHISNKQNNGESHISSIQPNQKLIEKLAKNKARLVFLLKCRRNNLIPRFIIDKMKNIQPTFT